ncbi:hypothetical protein ACWAUC_19765 [Bradyrhizobium guangdongense]
MVVSVAAKKAEIACRYNGAKRGNDRVHLAPIRISELCRLFRARYGQHLPDDDAGRDDARIMAHHLAMITGDQRRRIASWLGTWAPWMRLDEMSRIIEAVIAKPFRWNADTLGKRLNLAYADRQRLKITSIGAVDVTKAQRAAARKARKREDMSQRRRAAGVKPRSQYEATAAARAKPWEAEGVSRATWYRRNAAK